MNKSEHGALHPAPVKGCLVCLLLKRRADDVIRNRRWRAKRKAEKPEGRRKIPTVFDGPKQNRKRCHECRVYVGGRTTTCVCGSIFTPSPSERRNQK
jgi:hypothetical protein